MISTRAVVYGLFPTDLFRSHTASMTNVKPHIRNSHVCKRELEKYTNGKYNEQSPGMYPQKIWVVSYAAAGATMSDGSCDKLRFSFTRRVLYLTNTSYNQKGNSIDQAQ